MGPDQHTNVDIHAVFDELCACFSSITVDNSFGGKVCINAGM